jgi:hypothetical protein
MTLAFIFALTLLAVVLISELANCNILLAAALLLWAGFNGVRKRELQKWEMSELMNLITFCEWPRYFGPYMANVYSRSEQY